MSLILFKHIHEKKAYFISRYKSDTNLYDAETNQKIDLLEYLDDGGFLLKEVFLGKEVRLKVRLIGYKVTSQQAEHRRSKAHKLAKSHGYTSSSRNQKLLGWSLFITNIPKTKVKAKNIGLLYKLRWQIELLFKLYKSHFRLDKFQTSNPCRVLCELYARLCVILIFHALSTCLMIKNNTEISLTKAYLDFKSRARGFFLVLQEKMGMLS